MRKSSFKTGTERKNGLNIEINFANFSLPESVWKKSMTVNIKRQNTHIQIQNVSKTYPKSKKSKW